METRYAVTVSTKEKSDFNYEGFQKWAIENTKAPIFAEHENNNWHFAINTERRKDSVTRTLWDQFIKQDGNIKKRAILIKPIKNFNLWVGYMAHEGIERMKPAKPSDQHFYETCFAQYKEQKKEPTIQQNIPTLVYNKVTYEQLPFLVEYTAKENSLSPLDNFEDCMEILAKQRYAIHVFSQGQLKRVKAMLKVMQS